MSLTFYDICWFFVAYAVVGWIVEVIFHAVVKGNIVNRGFLNGPVCPVYGFGMVAVLAFYNLIGSDNTFVVFLEGVVFTTLIELIAGFILDKFFHARWWDYSKMPLNFHGYICAAFSIIWGMAVVFVLKTVHVVIYNATSGHIPPRIGWPILIFLYAVFVADTIVTVLTLVGLNKKLEELDRISNSIKSISDRMTDSIGGSSLKATQKVQQTAVQASLAKLDFKDAAQSARQDLMDDAQARIDGSREVMELRRKDLQDRYDKLRTSITSHRHFGAGRIINAFPEAKHRDYKEILEELSGKLREKR